MTAAPAPARRALASRGLLLLWIAVKITLLILLSESTDVVVLYQNY